MEDLEELANQPVIHQHSVNYIKAHIGPESSAYIDDMWADAGRVTIHFPHLAVLSVREDHPEIREVDTYGDGMYLTFDLTTPIEQIAEGLDINTCPQCEWDLEDPVENKHERVCTGCGDRYVVNTVSFIKRLAFARE